MWEVLRNEPLACIFWCCLFVFLATWAWAGERYSTRAQNREAADWKRALKWANDVQSPEAAPLLGDDKDNARRKLYAARIHRGESNEVYGQFYL